MEETQTVAAALELPLPFSTDGVGRGGGKCGRREGRERCFLQLILSFLSSFLFFISLRVNVFRVTFPAVAPVTRVFLAVCCMSVCIYVASCFFFLFSNGGCFACCIICTMLRHSQQA